MDPEVSPPKRVTRARAAKAPNTSSATSGTAASAAKSKTAAAAASKARATTTDPAPVVRTSTKRKEREEDHDDDSEVETVAKRPLPGSRTATRATRAPGRPKKTADSLPAPAPAPAPRATRGRPPKKVATEAAKEKAATRATRTRAGASKTGPGQVDEAEQEGIDDLAPEPAKKPRGRPAGTATSASVLASKPKKTVTFAEPDKENVVPITGPRKRPATTKPAEAPATTGLRAKPVRKPAGAGRTARTTATKKTGKDAQDRKKPSMPLSPKKVSQLSASRDQDMDSEDELAMDGSPVRFLKRSPVKPAGGNKRPAKVLEEASDEEGGNVPLASEESTTLLKSPVRRPPPSTESSMQSPAKRVDGLYMGPSSFNEHVTSSSSPFKASLLQSPAKRMPTKNTDLNPFSRSQEQTTNIAQSSASPFKASMLQSPAKRMPIKPLGLEPTPSSYEQKIASPLKQSLFQSPAKRGFSPYKTAKTPMPEDITDTRSPAPTPVLLCSPPIAEEDQNNAPAETIDVGASAKPEEEDTGSPAGPDFNGRMSTLLPREMDPTLDTAPLPEPEDKAVNEDYGEIVVLEERAEEHVEIFEDGEDSMEADGPRPAAEEDAVGDISTTPPNSPPKATLAMFGLREKDLVPFDTTYSESDDEITTITTPKTVSPVKQMRGSVMRPRTSGLGFTPLARRFDEWQPQSPHNSETPTAGKTPKAEGPAEVSFNAFETKETPTKDTFFDEEISADREEANESANGTDPLSGVPEIKDPVIEDISITDEDLDLAAEANEMSVMSPEQVESMLNLDGSDDLVSEASQEYGDENEVPAQFSNGVLVPPVTPQRRIRREFHTVSKVPLKAADESTPPPQPSLKKRRQSISGLPPIRPTHQMSRSATVISYSPVRSKQVDTSFEEAAEEQSFHERSRSLSPPATPSKSEAWSAAETPGRTPRRDVNSTLLQGAVVFVDVHTVEGADASAIFVELLAQMGARCVKTWPWNPNAVNASSKIGITHVIFKDGGKRTMEKVRETSGAVHCVGVGWVLE